MKDDGKWIPVGPKETYESVMCTNCESRHPYYYENYNYCPTCGAKMVKKEEKS